MRRLRRKQLVALGRVDPDEGNVLAGQFEIAAVDHAGRRVSAVIAMRSRTNAGRHTMLLCDLPRRLRSHRTATRTNHLSQNTQRRLTEALASPAGIEPAFPP